MSIRVTCPGCDRSYSVANAQRGADIRCKYCKDTIAVPRDDDDDDDDEGIYDPKAKAVPQRSRRDDDDEDDRRSSRRARERDEDEEDEPRRPQQKAKSGLLGILLLVGGGVAVLGFLGLVLVGALIWVFAAGPGGDNQAAGVNNFPVGIIPPPMGGPPVIMPDGPPIVPGGAPDAPFILPPANDPPAAVVQIDPATRDRVKASTVYLHVTMPNGNQASGSGFFAIEPGIVITNAHVLGMLQAQSKPPASVDVVVHSGEPGEKTLNGTVLGADRDTDLAVVRVNDPSAPPPLPVHTATTLQPLQEVYFFGYPYGKRLGTEVSINRASVSSLRKGTNGALAQVQLTGDMQPGNSGGPVVDKDGRIVGIAVAIIRGTRINFAVPADKIKPILDGRIEESTYGDPFVVNNEIKMPVKFKCLDPLRRVKALRVEVWAGPKGEARPIATEQPAPLPGDSPRKTVVIDYQNGLAAADVPLPSAPPGQVYWLQPVIVDGAGATHWHSASPREASPPLQRIPAELRLKVSDFGQNTLKIKDTLRMSFRQGKKEFSEALHVETTLLETLCPIGPSTNIGISVGANQFSEEELFGKFKAFHPNYPRRISNLKPPPNFIIAATGRMLVRSHDPKLNPKLPKDELDTLDMMYHRICEAFQQTLLVLPNRQVQPLEKYRADVPTLVGRGKNKKQVDLRLTCTYLGSRVAAGRNEALINIDGTAHYFQKGRGTKKEPVGNIVGRAVLDIDHGHFSLIVLRLWSELDLEGDLQMVRSETIRLTRTAGNTDNIAETAPRPPAGTVFPPNSKPKPVSPMPMPPIGPKPSPQPRPKTNPPPMPPKLAPKPPVPMGDPVLLNVKGALTKNDFLGGPRGRKHKTYDVKMEAGKTYVLEMKPVQGKTDLSAINPFLQLVGPDGKEAAKDDDSGGGKSAKITYTATQAGTYRVVATTMSGIQLGRYQLTVTAKD